MSTFSEYIQYKVFCRTHVFCEQYHAMSSNSKSHNGKTRPAGSYKTVSNWLFSQSTKELDFPQSDCMVAFDNDQVVGKSWRVSTDNKVKSSCVTSICAVAIDTGSFNFSNEQFKIAINPKKKLVQLHWICTKT